MQVLRLAARLASKPLPVRPAYQNRPIREAFHALLWGGLLLIFTVYLCGLSSDTDYLAQGLLQPHFEHRWLLGLEICLTAVALSYAFGHLPLSLYFWFRTHVPYRRVTRRAEKWRRDRARPIR